MILDDSNIRICIPSRLIPGCDEKNCQRELRIYIRLFGSAMQNDVNYFIEYYERGFNKALLDAGPHFAPVDCGHDPG